ncbi:MAG: tetratricopeptide repeat protein [Elusimicrobia bacterium]|nr:tetratricopeptide repeat protein [Elusimicrobiota bacterium]
MTKKTGTIKKLVILTLLCILNALDARSAFEDVEIGAKAASMAGAFVSKADDVSGMFYNPAGIVQLDRPELLAAYERMYWGLSDESNIGDLVFASGMPLKNIGNIGFAYHSLSLDDLYSENTIKLGYGRPITSKLYGGFNVSNLNVKYKETDYTKLTTFFDDGTGKSALSLDAGMIYKGGVIDLGLAAININEPDMAIKYTNKVSRKIVAGLSFKKSFINLNIADVFIDTGYRVKTGIEAWVFKRKLALRGGIGIGSLKYRNAAAGFGYNGDKYAIDYSFAYPLSGIADIYGSHQLSFLFKWGRSEEKEEEEIKTVEEEPAYYQGDIMELKRFYFMRGYGLYRNGKYKESIVEFNKVLEIDPEHEESHKYIKRANFMAGHSLFKYGKYTDSIREFEKVLDVDAGHGESHSYIKRANFMAGHILFREGRYKECIQEFEKVLDADHNNREAANYIKRATFMIGHAYFKEKKYEEAIAEFEKILKTDPEHRETKKYIKRSREEMIKERMQGAE